MSLNNNFACDQRALEVLSLAREILGESLISIQVVSLKFAENFEANLAKFEAKIIEVANGLPKKATLHGEGVGLMDACFDAMIKGYEQDYCSLDTISIVDFSTNAHLDRASKRKSDAKVTAMLRIKNSDNQEYTFECTTSSISHSTISVVKEAVSFFINAEAAYTRLHFALVDAKERTRHDLIARYQNQMGILVRATSYENLVARLRSVPKL